MLLRAPAIRFARTALTLQWTVDAATLRRVARLAFLRKALARPKDFVRRRNGDVVLHAADASELV